MNKKKRFIIHFVLGIIIALIGAFIIFEGSIFGENSSGIGIVINIIGNGIIASSFIWSIKSRYEVQQQ